MAATRAAAMEKEPEVPWKDSRAKKTLTEDILSGRVLPEWKPKQVMAMRMELYMPYQKNFGTNLRNLRKSLQALQDRADEDNAAVCHDLQLFPRSAMDPRGYPRWDNSQAQRFLKQDITEEKHKGLTTGAFRRTRVEYEAFPQKVFGDHVKQEVTSRLAKSYWLHRGKNKKKTHQQEAEVAGPVFL